MRCHEPAGSCNLTFNIVVVHLAFQSKTLAFYFENTLKSKVDYYNVKIIETPTSIEIWEYLDKPVIYTVKTEKEKEKELDIQEYKEEKTATEYYDALKRKQKHYENMRWAIARIIDCNFDDKTKFMTLTFKENIDDVAYTNYEFNKFIKRLNFYK